MYHNRAYENIVYCANPVDPIQKMNIYVPEVLAQGGTINGFTLKTAPIFMSNTVGGYMPGPAEKQEFFAFYLLESMALDFLLGTLTSFRYCYIIKVPNEKEE